MWASWSACALLLAWTQQPGPGADESQPKPPTVSSEWLQVGQGELPLVLSAPHGGVKLPAEWPVRSTGVKVRDTNTLELAIALREAIRARTGMAPFLVASRVHRRHLDLNRDRSDSGADLGEPQLELWRSYHESIEEAARAALRLGKGRALLIDLHGHGHDHGLIELGFAISAERLRAATPLEEEAWVRGQGSLGARLDSLGLASVPSPTRPAPLAGQAYFNGGYTVRRHRGAGLRSIQIELPPHPRRLAAPQRQALVDGLADAIVGIVRDEFVLPAQNGDPGSTRELIWWGPGPDPWQAARPRSLERWAEEWPHAVTVFGVPVLFSRWVGPAHQRQVVDRIRRSWDRNADGVVDDLGSLHRLRRQGELLLVVERSNRPGSEADVPQPSWANPRILCWDQVQAWLDELETEGEPGN